VKQFYRALFALFLSMSLTACQGSARPGAIPLTIKSQGKTHRFIVEVAGSPEQQERGLMFRKSLPSNGGMIFPMQPARTTSFWMKNTVIPLDMIFIRTDGSIARIAAETIPYSLDPISSGEPVSAVLEIAGGRAATLGIVEDDIVNWKGERAKP
jgi:uncharacterized protein